MVFHFQGYTLTADQITYDRTTGMLRGTGNVRLIDPRKQTILAATITIPDCISQPLKKFFVTGRARTQSP